MKKKHFLFFLLLFIPFGLFVVISMYNNSLEGKSLSLSLQEEYFEGSGIYLSVPDDWILFDIKKAEVIEIGFDEGTEEEYLVIYGAKPEGSFPRMSLYDFSGGTYTIADVVEWDAKRVENEYNSKLFRINSQESENEEYLIFKYQVDEENFLTGGQEIECKDWVGERPSRVLLISICATDQQWIELDSIYFEIIQSLKVK